MDRGTSWDDTVHIYSLMELFHLRYSDQRHRQAMSVHTPVRALFTSNGRLIRRVLEQGGTGCLGGVSNSCGNPSRFAACRASAAYGIPGRDRKKRYR
jgi:hypothetical protein